LAKIRRRSVDMEQGGGGVDGGGSGSGSGGGGKPLWNTLYAGLEIWYFRMSLGGNLFGITTRL